MTANQGYAGFGRPGDIVNDKVLTRSEKAETLLHWQRSATLLARLAPEEERAAYQKLTMELAIALARIDNAASTPHILPDRSLKSSQA
ncbi:MULTISPECIES: hypothetical protein [Kaistia]|uniref:Uncharacterized protein n=1 Tax=Kaistia nematophila TaxID=2994654 RepID=A0A9X3E0G3_9HYPH|nr:hypothetical protein [Kaistia nematophila]MCX5568267.1 hypothetical protein [Kaistia nematophila]